MTTAGTDRISVDMSLAIGTNMVTGHLSSSLCIIPQGYSWGNSWSLMKDLFVEIRASSGEVVAVTYLTLEEYGVSNSAEQAIPDLLTSLSDYYESLVSREERLAPSAREDLAKLRHLIVQTPTG